ncbi:MAG: bifunctional diaminohydroxyphosphoribosylaminopyrimidine deaminase/5-amino-6-(5-phosphoribosylamino)uracil reductase RibD [Dehalococcoidia bacterium]|nr:bifunctional diaminohydroxyphosphoribosylaminopyrimidine deaminase/5-amino-6-(5-phosphoribosylamino)uracil reductase RibD [Dehalococcoidia bacterium]
MECALSLAELAVGYSSPNPAVGAVVARDGFIVGMGYTQPAGGDHAEVMALRQAGAAARKATMYVTLEPCCHYGRTPPCTGAIIGADISEVHVAMLDPNPVVSGQGICQLNDAHIRTYVGEYQQEAYRINEAYVKYITTGQPFVIAKFAASLDGKIATRTGDSKWITSSDARRYARMLRHSVDAIMVGAGTVIADNPRLTSSGCGGRGGLRKEQPLRVAVDSHGRVPSYSHVFDHPGCVLLAVAESLGRKQKERLAQVGAEVIELPGEEGLVNIEKLLQVLGERKVVSVLVEGGGKLLGSLFDRRLVDKVMAFIAPVIIGGNEARIAVGGRGIDSIAEAWHLKGVSLDRFGDNMLVSGYI